MPSFLLGLFLMLVFAVLLGWLPVAGYSPLEDGLVETLRYLLLPAIALGSMQAALIARMTRTSMLETLSKPYLKTAKAKGLSGNRIIYKHALKNAAMPILTTIGQTLGTLVAGAAVVETVFNVPGLGQLIVNSIERRDIVVIAGSHPPHRRVLCPHQLLSRRSLQRPRPTCALLLRRTKDDRHHDSRFT